MPEYVLLLSIPNLRQADLPQMPHLRRLMDGGDRASHVPSFPAVTCPVQTNLTTGVAPNQHGVVANGFYWRESRELEMWTAWNDKVRAPQIWDRLHQHDESITSAAWFTMLSKGCGADFVCTPAPKHQADGTESLWCYTKPEPFYEQLLPELGHFPLQHFWGPLANIKSTAWIIESSIRAAARFRPNFFLIYLPHLDYAAQKFGPDSDAASVAVEELDEQLGKLIVGLDAAYQGCRPLWLAASEYVIVPVQHAAYPNRLLREAGLLTVREDGEMIDLARSDAWALVDHQLAHVYCRDGSQDAVERVSRVFRGQAGIAEVLAGDQRQRYDLDCETAGDIVLVSEPSSWQAYYWWLDDAEAPAFARTVDIHRKPGYDPVELHFDPATREVPLDASLIRGSHGAPAVTTSQRGMLLSSQRGVFVERPMADTDVAEIVMRQFGV